MFRPDALRQLARHFDDATIGGVCGRLVFVKPGEQNPDAEGSYWSFETKLKLLESALGSCLGANGAIYAIRPALWWNELPSNTIVDDFVIGMKVREYGARLLRQCAEPLQVYEIHRWVRGGLYEDELGVVLDRVGPR